MPTKKLDQINKIAGTVHHITYHHPDSGFCVFRIIDHDAAIDQETCVITAHVESLQVGESVQCSGQIAQHPKYGLQFKAEQCIRQWPSTQKGLEKYLASGLVPGIGASFAKKLVGQFGEKLFDIIEQEPERLDEVDGIGKKRRESLCQAWSTHQQVHRIMAWLQSHGLGCQRASKIYQCYGDQAVDQLQKNPYQLVEHLHGFGFLMADTLAKSIGYETESPQRITAGLVHTIQAAEKSGHTLLPEPECLEQAAKILNLPLNIIEPVLKKLITEGILLSELGDPPMVIHPRCQLAELSITNCLNNLQHQPKRSISYDPQWLDEQAITLSDGQKKALQLALDNNLCIITGGPGVGKTTLVRSLVKIFLKANLNIELAAPTGRAAKRLTQSTSFPAKTIHRLLEYNPVQRAFSKNEEQPLPIDVLIVDETSMIDIFLMADLLKALPNPVRLILVGDVDQLPSVGPGVVLKHLIESKAFPVAYLEEIFRQAKHSLIIKNSRRILAGQFPIAIEKEKKADFYTIYYESPEQIEASLKSLILDRLPKYFKLDSLDAIQVLCPMQRGLIGTKQLNQTLQQIINPNQPVIAKKGDRSFCQNDRVIQLSNNYEKMVFNGDLGHIVRYDSINQVWLVRFGQREIAYQANELDAIQLAYAITIHKSQGSEFPIVIIPMTTQHFTLLERNLLYTAVTRGKRMVILLAQKKALAIALNTTKAYQRYSLLQTRLQQ
jgi:exodeoxyribonuclease V alpha subunit